MRFARIGRTYQPCIETSDDLQEILSLDESLWVATSAPLTAFHCDAEFMSLFDVDRNGRIYSDELKAAIGWLLERLADTSRLAEHSDSLPISAIQPDTPDGQTLVESARYVLDDLARAGEDTITLGEVREFVAGVQSKPFNGDGVIVPDAASDADLKSFIEDIVACSGGAVDASGRKGIREEHLDAFMSAARAYLEWKKKAEMPEDSGSSPVMPMGEGTAQAYAIYEAHQAEANAFFALCNALHFRPEVAAQVERHAELESLDPTSVEQVQQLLKRAPLAELTQAGALPLSEENVNPLYRQWLSEFKANVVEPVLGHTPGQLSEQDWERIKSFFVPYESYLQEKVGAEVESLPIERLEKYCDGQLELQARELIEADKDVAGRMAGVGELKHLLLYHQNLLRLVNNFVSFPELYSTDRRALFEMGSAVIDGRWFNLCMKVGDVAAHSAIAKMSNVFTLYLEITSAEASEKFVVVSPVTSGSRGNLGVGKRGVFFDVRGKEYDARVVSIIENPISLREALVAPFVRLGRLIVGKIGSLAEKAEKKLEGEVSTGLAPQPQSTQPAGAAASPMGMFVGLSLAVAALSSAFAYIVKTFVALEWYHIVLGLGALVVIVSLPVTLLAVIKLRRRDLGSLVEGCGWAINARMRLTRAQRRYFTRRVPYPASATGTPGRRWRWILLIVLVGGLAAGSYYGIKALVRHGERPKATEVSPPYGDSDTAIPTPGAASGAQQKEAPK